MSRRARTVKRESPHHGWLRKVSRTRTSAGDLREDDGVIDIPFCGVCHADMHLARNWRNSTYPLVPGYEIVGRGTAHVDNWDAAGQVYEKVPARRLPLRRIHRRLEG